MKSILIILISTLLFSCKGNSQNENNLDKVKDTEVVAKKLKLYNNQKHRLSLNGCQFSYNGEPFELGTTINDLISIFGKYDYFNLRYYVWKDLGIVCSASSKKENTNNKLAYIYIYMNTEGYEEYKNLIQLGNHKEDYFLLNGNPLDKKTLFNEFINSSTYNLNDDFGASRYTYYLTEECDVDKKIQYSIKVKGGVWDYSGSGHIRVKKGLNQNNDSLIEYISIGYAEEEE